MKILKPIVFAALFLTSACADQLYPSFPQYMQSKKLTDVKVENFPHCQNYGCKVVKRVELNQYDWTQIEKSFGGKAKTAEQEREKIAKTIGAFEQIVGPITKTENDKGGTFGQLGDGQLDCVDESSNSTVYLMMLKQKGLLVFHEIGQPQVRYPILSGRGWMHQTAVIIDKETRAEFAVDSWYEDNGTPAYVVPMEDWRNGWHPQH